MVETIVESMYLGAINSRLDNLQAAILLEKFKTFGEDIKLRREIRFHVS